MSHLSLVAAIMGLSIASTGSGTLTEHIARNRLKPQVSVHGEKTAYRKNNVSDGNVAHRFNLTHFRRSMSHKTARQAASTESPNGVLRWSGTVDDVVDLRISNRRVDVITRKGEPARNVSYDLSGESMSSRKAFVRTRNFTGRGNVELLQQPSIWNGHTAIVRIRDNMIGASHYEIDIHW